MKKKILKVIALALCFTMMFSVVAFAADSPDTGNNSGIETPTQGTEEEPSQGTEEEPTQGTEEEPSQGTEEEPTQGTEEEPTQGTEEEPSQGTEEEPSQGTEEEPSKGTIEELAYGVTADNVVFNGEELAVTIDPVGSEAVLDEAKVQAAKLVSENAAVLKLFDVNLPEGDYSTGIQIRFNISGIQAGQTVYVLHQKNDGSWENLVVNEVGNNSVTATFTSFSPVAIVVPDMAPGTGDDSSKAKPLIALAVVAVLAGAAFVVYKKKFSVI